MSSLLDGKIIDVPRPSFACKNDGCTGAVEKQVKGVSAAGFSFSLPRCIVCGATYSATEFGTVPTKGEEEFKKYLILHMVYRNPM